MAAPVLLTRAHPVDVRRFGAQCNGLTDDTAAFQRAFDQSDDVFFSGDCAVSSLTITNDGTRLSGSGKNSILRMASNATGALLTTGANAVVFRDFRLLGGSATDKRFVTSQESNRTGISVFAQMNSYVSNVMVDGFGAYGIKMVRPTDVDNFDNHLIVSNTKVRNCFIGISAGPEAGVAEYIILNGLDLAKNSTALEINSGNVTGSNCKISNNRVGLHLRGEYGNNGHGNLSNSLINHSVTYSVLAEDIAVGFNLIGNNIHLGSILFDNCVGINIQSGIIQVGELRFKGGGRCLIANNYMFPNVALPNTVIHNSDGDDDAVMVRDNYTSTGLFPDTNGGQI